MGHKFIRLFTNIDMVFWDCDGCIIKIVRVMDLSESDVIIIMIGHINNCK